MKKKSIKKMTSREGSSKDFVKENLKALNELFPEAFTEGKIDFEVLRQLLGDEVDEGEEKYGLSWHGKKNARRIALTPSLGTLRPCKEESVDWDTTGNLFIEGDNLEVLKLLQKSYAGKVKMIYIDPPYNTGNEFIYPDKFKDNLDTYLRYTGQKDDEGFKISTNTESSGRYHTNWLNMMYPRLKLARSLLRDDGAIFISIDDNEVASLRKVCDEIFGEENFLGTIVWKKKTNGNNMGYIPPVHDYFVCYAKFASDKCLLGFLLDDTYLEKTYSNSDNDLRGPWTTTDLSANHKGPYFPITNPETKETFLPPTGRYWVFNEKEVKKRIADGRIIFGKSGTGKPIQKKFLSERKSLRRKAETWWDNHGLNEDGTIELSQLLSPKIFNHPKPSKTLMNLCSIVTNENDFIIDFFAGSCSSAHATMNLNKEDGGSRKYIMVQLPEPCDEKSEAFKAGYKNIADIGKERIRRAAAKIKEENPDYKGDLGFKVFKLDSSNIRAWNPDPDDLEQTLLDHTEHLVEGRSEEDVLYELLLKRGIDLTAPIEEKTIERKTVYSIGYGVLFVCLAEKISRKQVEPLAEGIIRWREELSPAADTQVVFRDSAFENDITKTNMAAILEQQGIAHVRSL